MSDLIPAFADISEDGPAPDRYDVATDVELRCALDDARENPTRWVDAGQHRLDCLALEAAIELVAAGERVLWARDEDGWWFALAPEPSPVTAEDIVDLVAARCADPELVRLPDGTVDVRSRLSREPGETILTQVDLDLSGFGPLEDVDQECATIVADMINRGEF